MEAILTKAMYLLFHVYKHVVLCVCSYDSSAQMAKFGTDSAQHFCQ